MKAYVARNDQLSKQNDMYVKQIKDIVQGSSNISKTDVVKKDIDIDMLNENDDN